MNSISKIDMRIGMFEFALVCFVITGCWILIFIVNLVGFNQLNPPAAAVDHDFFTENKPNSVIGCSVQTLYADDLHFYNCWK